MANRLRNSRGQFLPHQTGETKCHYNLTLTPSTWQTLGRLAKSLGISRSQLVERVTQTLAEAEGPDSAQGDGALPDIQYRHLEQQLREREQFIRQLAEAVPDFLWSCDAAGKADFVNHRWCEYTGLTLEELNAGGLAQINHPEDYPTLMEGWARAAAVAEPFEAEFRYRRFDGEYRWFMGRTVPIKDQSGRVVRWVGTTTDIHERKIAQLELERVSRDLARRLQESEALFEVMPIGLCVADDPHCHHIRTNLAVEQMLGIDRHTNASYTPPADAPPPPFRLCKDGRELAGYELPMQAAADHNRRVDNWEFEVLRADGSRVQLVGNAVPLQDTDGSVRGAVGAFVDITRRKQTEQALSQSEERYRSLVEASPTIVWTTGATGNFIAPQPGWEGYTGEQGPTGADMGGSEAIHPEDRVPVARCWAEACAGSVPFEFEARLWHAASGRHRWCLVRSVPLMDAERSVREWVGTFTDIDDQKRTQENLRFLDEAGKLLAEQGLDYRAILERITHLAIPQLADWCALDLVEQEGVPPRRVALAHIDPAQVQRAWQLHERYPLDWNGVHGAAGVLRTGRSEMVADIPDAMLVASARDAEHLEILRELGLRSYMCVPLVARARVLGVLSFVSSGPARAYTPQDLAVAEALAERCALAIDNARLYASEQRARAQAEVALTRLEQVQAVTVALSAPLDREGVGRVLIEQGVGALGAVAGTVALLNPAGDVLEVVAVRGYPQILIEQFPRFPLSANAPITETVRTGQLITICSAAEWMTRYPDLRDIPAQSGNRAWLMAPLEVEGRVIGGLVLSFAEARHFEEPELAMVRTLAHQCAQAFERARLYAAEQQARSEAQTANRRKDEFLAILSHELKTPLNPIIGWTQLLKRGALDPGKQAAALEVIERNAKLQNQLISDLLDVSRIEQGKFPCQMYRIDLIPVVSAACEAVLSLAETANLKLTVRLPEAPLPVQADPTRIQQVVWNLLTNAIKFTPRDGQVDLSLTVRDRWAMLSVADTGVGIAPEFIPYLFERFRQADSTTTRKQGGLGLGLFIVQHIVAAHGGRVWAESAGEGQGAVFTIALPLA